MNKETFPWNIEFSSWVTILKYHPEMEIEVCEDEIIAFTDYEEGKTYKTSIEELSKLIRLAKIFRDRRTVHRGRKI